MKKHFTLLAAAFLLALQLNAQSLYTLSASNAAYVPLAGAASANGAAIWATQVFVMPLGFTAMLGNTTVTKVFTDGTDILADTAGAAVSIFQAFFAYTVDRGTGGSVSKSPLRYTTTGTAPSRIFKYECQGVGFFKEQQMYSTFNDSVNVQFWLYEGSNAVEIHFGPSKISHAADYFQSGTPTFTGYFNVNMGTGAGNYGTFASGPVAAPYTDSFTAARNPDGLSAYPPSGTVYRFTPRITTGVGGTSAGITAAIYPTRTSGALYVACADRGSIAYDVLAIAGSATGIRGTLRPGTSRLDVDALPAGDYLLRMYSGDAVLVLRFVKL